MAKTVTIHQPNYIPWLGFFGKIKAADTFVILDTVEYTKNSVINRNKIRIREGEVYLTIPIEKIYHSSKIIDVKLPKDNRWKKNHYSTIECNYCKADHFQEYKDDIKAIYEKDYEYLWQINEEFIRYLMKKLGIEKEIIKASNLNIDPTLKKTDLLIDILKKTNATKYLSGPSGKDYLEVDKFQKENIELEYYTFKHPQYKQRYPGFIPNLSTIDLLLNMGEEGGKLI